MNNRRRRGREEERSILRLRLGGRFQLLGWFGEDGDSGDGGRDVPYNIFLRYFKYMMEGRGYGQLNDAQGGGYMPACLGYGLWKVSYLGECEVGWGLGWWALGRICTFMNAPWEMCMFYIFPIVQNQWKGRADFGRHLTVVLVTVSGITFPVAGFIILRQTAARISISNAPM